MKIYEYEDFRAFTRDFLRAMPKRGYGQLRKIAELLHVHTTFISQVLSGKKNLSLEQGYELCSFLGLTDLETEYFLTLVHVDRAGNHKLKKYYLRKLRELYEKAQQLSHRLPKDKILSEESKAVFYSSWYFSGIRLLTSIPGFHSIDSIAEHFKLPRNLIAKSMDFLLSSGLCKEDGGKISMGPSRTHIEADSPFVGKHHLNWRLKTIEKVDHISPQELMFTSPVTLSRKDFNLIRKMLIDAIEKVGTVIDESPAETLGCLNIDWFEVK